MGLKTWWSDRRLERMFDDAGALLERRDAADDRARDRFADYADDPVGFIRDVIGDTPWGKQVEIAHAVRDHDRVTVRSCHAAGKDWLAARLALWWTYARDGLVVLTGPTSVQVEEILMRNEIRAAFRAGNLPGELHVRALRPGAADGRAGILARTSRDVSRLTGFHDARVLFVITEAQDPDLAPGWDAAFAVATGAHDRILTLGNPTETGGRFHRAHRPDSGWHAIAIPAADVPNVRDDRTVVPGLLSRRAIERYEAEYGADSGFVAARVHAEFPDTPGTDRVFPRPWLQAAAARHRDGALDGAARNGVWVAGLDPAGGGASDTVMAVRQGPTLRELVTLGAGAGDAGGEALVDEVVRVLADRAPDVAVVVVDTNGPGAFLAPWLAERGVPVMEFSGGSGPADPDRFLNLRAESHWTLREDLRRGFVALPDDDALMGELTAIRWAVDAKGRIKLEDKQTLKSRIGRSPDRADAVSMAFWIVDPPAAANDHDPVAGEVSGNFIDDMMGRDPRHVVDEDRAAGWTPTGRPIGW